MKMTIYVTILLALVVSRIDGGWIKAKRDLQGCQNCLHLTFEIYNMPPFYKAMAMSALSGLNMADTDCLAGTSPLQVCPSPQYPDMLVDRCHSATMTITAEGLEIMPEAKMVVYMVARGCGRVDSDTENTCGGLEMLDDEDRAHIRSMLGQAQEQWNRVELAGDVCIGDLQSLY